MKGIIGKITNHYRGLPRSIYMLFGAQVVNAMGNLVYPFLTYFLTQKLNYEPAAAGRFILVASTAFVPGSLIGGKLADLWGRKKVLLGAQALAGLMFLPCAFLGASPLVPWFIIAADFFNGAAMPTHEAITADLTTPGQRQPAFALLYLGHNIGFAMGPLIAGFLFIHALPWLFLGDVITTFLALTLVLLFVPETKPTEEAMAAHGKAVEPPSAEGTDPPDASLPSLNKEEGLTAEGEQAEEGTLRQALFRRPRLIIFTLISLILSFVYSQFTFSLPLQMEEFFPLQGPFYFGSLMTVNALVVILLTTPLNAATKRLSPLTSISLAALLFAAGFGIIPLTSWALTLPQGATAAGLGVLGFSTVIWTLGEILNATNTNVYISANTPISHRGRFNSVLPIIMGAGFALGPVVMGGFIEAVNLTAVWFVAAGLSLISAGSLVLLKRKSS